MGKEDAGESSSSSSSKDDNNSDDAKPLKKARYVWEVKGKLHLKNKHKHQNSSDEPQQSTSRAPTVPEPEISRLIVPRVPSINNDVPPHNNNFEDNNNQEDDNNNHFENNNNVYTNRCCMEPIAARAERIMEIEVPREDLQGSSSKTEESQSPNPKNEDYYLLRWQARQVAKGFVDNTINRVLEHWLDAPFDAADLVENCESDGRLVDEEAILMAIQSHGLRQDSASSAGVRPDGAGAAVQQIEIAQSAMDNYENAHNEMKNSGGDGGKCEEDPMDFLNAAVSVAISKKGLSSSSYD